MQGMGASSTLPVQLGCSHRVILTWLSARGRCTVRTVAILCALSVGCPAVLRGACTAGRAVHAVHAVLRGADAERLPTLRHALRNAEEVVSGLAGLHSAVVSAANVPPTRRACAHLVK